MSVMLDNRASVQMTTVQRRQVLDKLIAVVSKEAAALSFLADHFPDTTVDLVALFSAVKGKVIFTGIGKSGVIAQKSAATFSSLGTPSLFLHAHDALHGDLGVMQRGDCLCAFSKSGQGDEFELIFAFARAKGIRTVLFCCSRGSIARLIDFVIDIPCLDEACELNLAPTCSTTSMLALSDALAVVVSWQRGFTQNDFAQYHPAGSLGKRLLLTVGQIMKTGEQLPLLGIGASFKDIIVAVTTKKLGCAVVVDSAQRLLGVVTDGDVRRACEKGALVFSQTADQLMSIVPKTITSKTLASTALALMESFNITVLIVVESMRVVGVLHIHDLVKAGIKGE